MSVEWGVRNGELIVLTFINHRSSFIVISVPPFIICNSAGTAGAAGDPI